MLSIHTFCSQYLVSQDHPSPEGMQRRLDDILQRRLPEALDEMMKGWEQNNPGVWFIRDLEINLDIDAAWEDEQIAYSWAESIVRSLNHSALDADGSCLHFADRTEYLARFLIDLSEGNAWQQWFYRPLSGLHMLPTSIALRSALEQEPGEGLTALTHLHQAELEKILSSLSEADARRLLMTFGGSVTAEVGSLSHQDALYTIWETWSTPRRSLCESAEAILHYVQTSLRPAQAGMLLVQGAVALTRLSRLLKRGERDKEISARLLAALAGGDAATLYVTAGPQDSEVLRPLLGAAPEWVWQVGQALSVHPVNAARGDLDETEMLIRYTPFGGAFLLLPFIDSLPVVEATQDWPDLKELPAEQVVRFLLLLKSLGGERAEAGFTDPLLRDLLLIPPWLSMKDIATWQSSIASRLFVAFHRVMSSWRVKNNLVEQDALVLTNLNESAQVVLLDVARLMWHCIGTIKQVRNRCRTIRVQSVVESGLAGEDLPARLAQVPEDLLYLRLPASFGTRRMFDWTLDIAAQNALRLFAWRLTGFARSGLAYLYRHFLDLMASLEDGPARRLVRLGRAPLALVLNMTGQNRQAYLLSWLDDRPFELYPEE